MKIFRIFILSVLVVFAILAGESYAGNVFLEGVVVKEKTFSSGAVVRVSLDLIEPIKGSRAKK